MGNLGACSVACVSGAEGGGEEREKGGKGALPSLPNPPPFFPRPPNPADYRIYSINRPGRLLNFWTFRMGAYSTWVLIRGCVLIRINTVTCSE